MQGKNKTHRTINMGKTYAAYNNKLGAKLNFNFFNLTINYQYQKNYQCQWIINFIC